MEQGPRTATVFPRHQVSVKVLAAIEVVIEGLPVPVQHIAGAISRGMVIRFHELRGSVTQFQDGLQTTAHVWSSAIFWVKAAASMARYASQTRVWIAP